jgi:hypothetical protein
MVNPAGQTIQFLASRRITRKGTAYHTTAMDLNLIPVVREFWMCFLKNYQECRQIENWSLPSG